VLGFGSVGEPAPHERRPERTTTGPTDDPVANPDSRGSQL
jgi:hypothetical protein